MGIEYDLKKAQEIAKTLSKVKIANPNEGQRNPRLMASSIAQAVMAKKKIGLGVSSKNKEFWVQQGKNVRRTMVGRCDQCAAAVISMIVEDSKWESTAELVGQGNHHFVVVGRNPISDIKKPNQWGKGCFVIDIWLANQYKMDAVIAPETMIKHSYSPKYFKVTQTWNFWWRLDLKSQRNHPW